MLKQLAIFLLLATLANANQRQEQILRIRQLLEKQRLAQQKVELMNDPVDLDDKVPKPSEIPAAMTNEDEVIKVSLNSTDGPVTVDLNRIDLSQIASIFYNKYRPSKPKPDEDDDDDYYGYPPYPHYPGHYPPSYPSHSYPTHRPHHYTTTTTRRPPTTPRRPHHPHHPQPHYPPSQPHYPPSQPHYPQYPYPYYYPYYPYYSYPSQPYDPPSSPCRKFSYGSNESC